MKSNLEFKRKESTKSTYKDPLSPLPFRDLHAALTSPHCARARAFDAAPSLAFDTVIDSFPANKHSIPKVRIREQPKTTGFTNRGYSRKDVTFMELVCPVVQA